MVLTDTQVDAIWQKTIAKEGCQYIGPDQKEWPYTVCGKKAKPTKCYCEDHYSMMYKTGTATSGKRKQKALEAELKELEAGLELQNLIAEQEADKEEIPYV
jgi:hypothetical protein